jgi:hypothetical protein
MNNILVKDDATTPKEWTLIPVTDTPNPYWRGNDAGVPIDGQPRLNFIQTRLKNGTYKLTAKLEVPTMETLGASGTSSGYVAPPKVAYVTSGIFSMFADKRSTVADRTNLLRMLVGILQGADSITGYGTLRNDSAGDAWKAAIRVCPSFFANVVLPS